MCSLHPVSVAVALTVTALVAGAGSARAQDAVRWSVGPGFRVALAPTPAADSAATRGELGELRSLQARRAGVARIASARWSADSAVRTWMRFTLEQIRAHNLNPVRAVRVLALVSVAMSDAIQTLRRSLPASHRPAPCRLDSRIHPFGGACAVSAMPADCAAAAQAASMVLDEFFPDRRTAVRRMTAQAVAWPAVSGVAYPSDVRAAVLVGRGLARRVVARMRGDGSSAAWSGPRPAGPGLWQPTPPGFSPPLEPLAGTWRTWNVERGAQFRPPPPPGPGSEEFDRETQMVYDTSRALTAQQRRVALFWADGPGTVTPPGHWNAIALRMLRGRGMSAARAAFVLATLNTTQADAFIACWDAKFAYWSVRPVTVIGQWWYDPAWSPLLVTPPFPSYPSGHATTSAAAATVLSAFFPRERSRLQAMAAQAAQSRLYAGIHFPSDTSAGLALGRNVAGAALRRVRAALTTTTSQ